MRVGVHLPQFREPVGGEDVAAAARAAEESGLHDVWVSDHLLLPVGSRRPPERFHDPLTVLTWAAAVTGRVGLGTSVIVAPHRGPVVLARAVASLDALSGGRVVMGIASGWLREEFDALGVPFGERGARTDETIDVCRALWSGRRAFAGRWTQFAGMALTPGPARQGGPPVWIGGNSDAGLRRAVARGDAWHTTISDPSELRRRLDRLGELLAAAGRPRSELAVSVRLRADPEGAARRADGLRDLGVDHLLVDLPRDKPASDPESILRLAALLLG